MILSRTLAGLLASLLFVTSVAAQEVRPRPRPAMGPEGSAMARAMAELRRGDWGDAREVASAASPIAAEIIEWHRLRAGRGDFAAVMSFLERHPDWPGLPYMRRRNEAALPHAGQAREVIAFFGDATPTTGHGVVSLVNAYRSLGDEGDAQALAALAWLELSMTSQAEEVLLRYYPELLAPLNLARLDAMLWANEEPAARRMLPRIDDPGQTALALARLALRADRSTGPTLAAAVPEALADDAGLAFERFRRLHRAGRDAEAAELIRARSTSAEGLGEPQVWAPRRRSLARSLMRAGEPDEAYAVASAHWLVPGTGYDFADLEWQSGYLALRNLDNPTAAQGHFARFRAAVQTPISLGRAGYWEGRAHEAAGDTEAAAQAYAFGAAYQTSFYGLLAAERAGLPMDPDLTGQQAYPPLGAASFRDSSVLAAALLLHAAGEGELAERFMVHLAESLDATNLGTLADIALALDAPHMGLMIAKQAASVGITLARPYYPVVDLGVAEMPVPPELALSIARRESEFNPVVVSGAGARGLMQLMPGTAQDVARRLGLPYGRQRLLSDASYNATLGTAYLDELIDRFGPNVVLVAAGYNAGPGRPARWITQLGDPRDEGVDVVDWIERIPFDETRNYVMRIAESLPVYRARLTGETAPIRLTEELKAR